MCGIYTDLIGRGKYLYTVILSMHYVAVLLIAIKIIVELACDSTFFSTGFWVYFLDGYLSSIGWVLIYLVLPLFVTGKEREKHSYFEIPVAAQILAIVNSS